MFPQLSLIKWAGALVVVLAIIAGIGYYGQKQYQAGVNAQKVLDQRQFDTINGQITQQKAQAASLLQDAQSKIVAQESELLALRATQGAMYAKDLAQTQAEFVSSGDHPLRVRLNCSATPGAGSGQGGGGAVPAPVPAPTVTATATVELPAPTEHDLRQLVLDADTLADNYRACYRAWHPEWREPADNAVIAKQ